MLQDAESHPKNGCLCCRFDKKTPQRLVGAATLLIAAAALFSILWPLRWSLLATWVVIELVFYVLCWRPRYAELNEQPDKHEPANLELTAMKTFKRFLRFCKELPAGNIDYQSYYSGWFRGAPFDEIKRGECSSWVQLTFSGSDCARWGLQDSSSTLTPPPHSQLVLVASNPLVQGPCLLLMHVAAAVNRALHCRQC